MIQIQSLILPHQLDQSLDPPGGRWPAGWPPPGCPAPPPHPPCPPRPPARAAEWVQEASPEPSGLRTTRLPERKSNKGTNEDLIPKLAAIKSWCQRWGHLEKPHVPFQNKISKTNFTLLLYGRWLRPLLKKGNVTWIYMFWSLICYCVDVLLEYI